VCGRRGGKTTLDGRLEAKALQDNPAEGEDESISLFVGPTKNQAKRLMWGRLQTIAKNYRIPIEWNNGDLIGRHANGAQFWIMGADDDRDVDRMRGFAYRRVIIDEAQSVGADFADLIDEVIEPALSDYSGDLVLTGTPNAACVGYFYEAHTGQRPGWEAWSWTVLDNPMHPQWRKTYLAGGDWRAQAEAWLDHYRESKGWETDNPTYLREWLGQWSRDEGGLVYQYRPDRDDWTGPLPEGHHWEYVLGIDLGQRDAFSIVTWAFCRDLPDLYCVDVFRKSGLDIGDWAREIKERQLRYQPVVSKADAGALGKAIVDDLNARHHLGLTAADKRQKGAAIQLMNTDFAARRIHVRPKTALTDEWMLLQWDEKRPEMEDQRFQNDASDASLYGYREAYHWCYRPKVVLPGEGTVERAEFEAKRLRELAVREVARQNRRRRWA
jgi:hypothetical protein